jgi:hypothetical protein
MPELDGPGFYQELARHYPQLLPRIIFLTGDMLSPEARAFLEHASINRSWRQRCNRLCIRLQAL